MWRIRELLQPLRIEEFVQGSEEHIECGIGREQDMVARLQRNELRVRDKTCKQPAFIEWNAFAAPGMSHGRRRFHLWRKRVFTLLTQTTAPFERSAYI